MLLEKSTGLLVFKENSGFSAAPKSIKFIESCFTEFIVFGLRDGVIVYYSIQDTSLHNKKSVMIGYQAVLLEDFVFNSKKYLFAACDRPVFLYNENNSMHITDLSSNDISFSASFNTEAFPDCLAIASKTNFSVISFPELQQFSIKSYIKKLTLRRFAQLDDKFVVIAQSSTNISMLQLYDNEKNLLDTKDFPNTELLNCIHIQNSRIYIGIGSYTSQISENSAGKIQIFFVNNEKLILLQEIQSNADVVNITGIPNHIIAGVHSEIHFFKVTENSLVLLDFSQKMSYIIILDSFDNLIAAADLFKSISVYTPENNKLKLLYKNYTLEYITAIKFINKKLITVADTFGNILVLKAKKNRILTPVSGISIGNEMVNVIKTLDFGSSESRQTRIIFATSKGRIGGIAEIKEKDYKILKALQECICGQNALIGDDLKKPKRDDLLVDINVFIQGDVTKTFLDLSQEKRSTLALLASEKLAEPVSAEYLGSLLFDLSR